MLMRNNDQLAMVQVGILISEFITPKEMPETLAEVAKIIYDNLGVKVERGDNLSEICQRVKDAIKERDELAELEDSFYTDWIEENLAKVFAEEIRKEIDTDIINSIIDTDKQMWFDDAMKGL